MSNTDPAENPAAEACPEANSYRHLTFVQLDPDQWIHVEGCGSCYNTVKKNDAKKRGVPEGPNWGFDEFGVWY